jgi:hypothetical protein
MSYGLNQNYPNPFNPTTTISYSIPERTFIEINVYNIRGEKIKNLVKDEQSPGRYKVIFDGSNFLSGIYIYRFNSDKFCYARKIILMK